MTEIADYEVWAKDKPRPADRYDLPYGVWVTKDGTVYLFNRRYQPIYRRAVGGKAEPCEDRNVWVKDIAMEFWLWSDHSDIAQSKPRADLCRYVVETFMWSR